MAYKIIIPFLLFVSFTSFSQEGQVLISEKKVGKRLVLHAENLTNDTINVFLLVEAKGYRKSASKPVIKDIPPKTKVPMLTMIALAEEESSYTYELILNKDIAFEETISYDNMAKDVETMIHNKIVVFTFETCAKCSTLLSYLKKNTISHLAIDINKSPVFYRQFILLIQEDLNKGARLQFPIVWNKDRAIFGYETIEALIAQF